MNVTNLPNDFWKIVNLMIFDGNKILLWKIAHLPTIDISRNPSQQKSPAGFVEITIGKNWSKWPHSPHCCRLQAIYSPIAGKNFVTVYTTFDPWNRGNLLLRLQEIVL